MANLSFVPPSLHTLSKTRVDKEFEILRGYMNHAFLTNPSGATTSNLHFLEGTVVDIDVSGRVAVAASGKGFGFAMQTVKDLTDMNGRRNMQKTEVHLGDPIAVAFGDGVCATKIHSGSGNPGDYAYWNGSTLVFVPYTGLPSITVSGVQQPTVKILGRLLHVDGTDTTAAVSGTAGTKLSASTVKALVMFDIKP